MINEIAPLLFDNSFRRLTPRPEDIAFIFDQKQILLTQNSDTPVPPSFAQLCGAKPLPAAEYLFSIEEQRFFLTKPPEQVPQSLTFFEAAHYIRQMQPQHLSFAACTAQHLYRWRSSRQFCGGCGSRMENGKAERSAVCPQCGHIEYPKISPAIIVAVTDGDRLLMAKGRNSVYKRFALVAGFVEIGESLEEAVAREVMEEVGLRIKNIRYYKSQPWGFSDSMMICFFAELDGDDTITMQQSELSAAHWFARSEIPEGVNTLSISQELIETVRSGEYLRYLQKP